MQFSGEEWIELGKAWLGISIAFAIFSRGAAPWYILLAISAITVGLGFLLHEIAHKWVAIRYGHVAEFKAWDAGILVALLMSFWLLFAAPGAVHVSGYVKKRENGIIAMAGPLANLILALLFSPLILFGGLIGMVGSYGYMINAWLALFNLLPAFNFDGLKVLEWNRIVYGVLVASAVLLVGFPTILRNIL